MKKSLMLWGLLQIVFAFPAAATDRAVEKPIGDYLAIATANTINRLGTVDNYLKWISTRAPEKDVRRLEKYLASLGVAKTQKFPKLKAFGSKVYFSATEYMTYTEKDIVIEGRHLKPHRESIDIVVKNIVDKLSRPRTAWYSMILPEAHAMSSAMSSALIGLVAGGALGYFAGPSLGVTQTEGALTGALLGTVAGLGVNYLGSESSYYLGNNGQVVCNGNNYYINNGTGTYLGSQNAYQQQVPPGVVMSMYNGPRPCTAVNAQYMQTNLRTWNQPTYLTSVNQQQHPGTLLGIVR